MAVSDDGRVFCTTTWEEGGRAPGIYHEGDALAHIPSLGISSGESVAVSRRCARATAYRVRALELNKSASDWSKTIYVR